MQKNSVSDPHVTIFLKIYKLIKNMTYDISNHRFLGAVNRFLRSKIGFVEENNFFFFLFFWKSRVSKCPHHPGGTFFFIFSATLTAPLNPPYSAHWCWQLTAFTARLRMEFVQSAFARANYTKLWLDNLLFPRKSWLVETNISCLPRENIKHKPVKNSEWSLDQTFKN